MAFSPRFRATVRIAALCGGLWAGIGIIVGTFRDPGFEVGGRMAKLPGYAIMFGALGVISGLATSLLLARAERGREAGQVAALRLVAWGALGGASPAMLFALLASVFGAPAGSFVPLLWLGSLGATVGGALGGAAGLAVRRAQVSAPRDDTKLPKP